MTASHALTAVAPADTQRPENLEQRVADLEHLVDELRRELSALRTPSRPMAETGTVITFVGAPPAAETTQIVALREPTVSLQDALEAALSEPTSAGTIEPTAADVTQIIHLPPPSAAALSETTEIMKVQPAPDFDDDLEATWYEEDEDALPSARLTSRRGTLEMAELAALGWVHGCTAFMRRIVGSSTAAADREELKLAGIHFGTPLYVRVARGVMLAAVIVGAAACVDMWISQDGGTSMFLQHLELPLP